MIAHIDFETRSLVDINTAGVHRYAMDPSTDILCMAWAIDDEEPALWLPYQPFPKRLRTVRKVAWNSSFEIAIWKYVGIRLYGWPEAPMEMWDDAMGDAAYCSFPLSLSNCCKALKTRHQKEDDGTRLINLLSKPISGTTEFRSYEEFPEEFHRLYEYCLQDIRAERDAYHALPAHVEGKEYQIQLDTWRTNALGVPVDTNAVRRISSRLDEQIDILDRHIHIHTNGHIRSATQRDRLLFHLEMNREAAEPFLFEHNIKKDLGLKPGAAYASNAPGMVLNNLQGDIVQVVLDEWEISDYDRTLLEIYQDKNHASVAKFKKILAQVCTDDTVKDNLQYHGAGTGRDAARGFQTQNLPRNTSKRPEDMIEMFFDFTAEEMGLIYSVLETASSLIRPMIKAPTGQKFVVSDYGQVEARGAAWAAKEEDVLDTFRQGIPIYEKQASDMYDIPIEDVDALQRDYGKLAVLACGFMGAHKALTRFAANYGLTIERKEAGGVVRAFRKARPKLVEAWAEFHNAAELAIIHFGSKYQVKGCQHAVFQMIGKHLTLELPSGRKIWYPEAELRLVTIKYEDEETGEMKEFETQSVTYMKIVKSHWVRGGISGGNLFQNYDQAICRDLLMEAALRAGQEGFPVVLRVHDELVTQVPDDPSYNIEQLNKIMCVLPDWAKGFPISAAGYESKRYKK